MLEPNVIVLYVNDLAISSQFYQHVFGVKPVEASLTFHCFTLSNGMNVALKAKHSVVPAIEGVSAYGEMAFTLESNKKANELFKEWQDKAMTIILPPTSAPFGYTFVALDPDGHRLRVVSLENHKE